MSGIPTEEFVYKLINVNDNVGYGDIDYLCAVRSIVMQRTFEDMNEEGKTLKDFTFKGLLHAFVETAVNIVGLYTKVKIDYEDNFLCTEVYFTPLTEVTEEQKEKLQGFLYGYRLNWK